MQMSMNYFAKEKSSPQDSANASFVHYEKKNCEEGKYVQKGHHDIQHNNTQHEDT